MVDPRAHLAEPPPAQTPEAEELCSDSVTATQAPGFAKWPLERPETDDVRLFGRRFFRDLFRGMAVVVLLHLFVVQISVVRGLSMEPSLRDGDRLIVDRLSYSVTDVERFDVVVMRNPVDESVDYVKRVVALPGESVSIRDGRVLINGRIVPVPFDLCPDHCDMETVHVPADHFFVLGDNRPVSCDSREFGLVQADLLKGKVRLRFWPLTRVTTF